MTSPSAFSDTFRQVAIPALKKRIRVCGLEASFGALSYAEAVAEVMREAQRLGAIHLSDKIFFAMQDWVLSELTKQIDRIDHMSEEYRLAFCNPVTWGKFIHVETRQIEPF